MSQGAPTVAVLTRDELERMLEEAAARGAARALAHNGPARREVISKREAARMLGIDRGATLGVLIAEGRIRTFDLRGRIGVSRADVERVIAEGAPTPQAEGRRRTGVRGGSAALRSLTLDDL